MFDRGTPPRMFIDWKTIIPSTISYRLVLCCLINERAMLTLFSPSPRNHLISSFWLCQFILFSLQKNKKFFNFSNYHFLFLSQPLSTSNQLTIWGLCTRMLNQLLKKPPNSSFKNNDLGKDNFVWPFWFVFG